MKIYHRVDNHMKDFRQIRGRLLNHNLVHMLLSLMISVKTNSKQKEANRKKEQLENYNSTK